SDGAFLSISNGITVATPIHVVFISSSAGSGGAPTISHPRVLIVAGESSRATVVESYVGPDHDLYLTNAVTEIVALRDSIVDHYRLQRESHDAFHTTTTEIAAGRGSRVTSTAVSLGAALARNDVRGLLAEEGADCTLNGLYVLHGSQHVDNHTLFDHAKPHGTSRELYKGVLDGRSRGVFDGTVIVREDAQKTDSRQENRNLILSSEALVDSKPTLQIHADDVKCSHAATTGQLDEQSMFYLRSRGIDVATARGIMIHAFVSDIIRRIKVDPVRIGLDCLLFTELPSDLGRGLAP
ncbi:MAG TPA: Fe-S cluster assembly protein SufD, partial [Candidatus Polarisedimenticolia bacterium]|nr:Fe-S cluster assembly protein SufD [Candidatus Polarisedimenticolia bacterium]